MILQLSLDNSYIETVGEPVIVRPWSSEKAILAIESSTVISWRAVID